MSQKGFWNEARLCLILTAPFAIDDLEQAI